MISVSRMKELAEEETMNEIIIDGVNVAECPDFDRYFSKITNQYLDKCNADIDSPYCEGNPNCYYKQLQRLKTENEKYKQALEEVRDSFNNRILNYEELKIIKKISEVLDERD